MIHLHTDIFFRFWVDLVYKQDEKEEISDINIELTKDKELVLNITIEEDSNDEKSANSISIDDKSKENKEEIARPKRKSQRELITTRTSQV